jgi:hypothetical protein
MVKKSRKLNLDEHNLPKSTGVWVRFDNADILIARNDNSANNQAQKIYSLCLRDSICGDAGKRSYKRSGTTPGGRRYEAIRVVCPDGQTWNKVEVFNYAESHIKLRTTKGERAKVVRTKMDSLFRGLLDTGDPIDKSYTTPKED